MKHGFTHFSVEEFQRRKGSLLYILYAVLTSLVLLGVTLGHIYSTRERLGAKWLIFLTNQCMLLIIANNLLLSCILLRQRCKWRRKSMENDSSQHKDSSALCIASNVLQYICADMSLFVSLLYWAAVHQHVVEHKLLLNLEDWVYNYFLHAFNTVTCLIDLLISGRPFRLRHFYLSFIFGLYYCAFSVIYWAAGGSGICAPLCDSPVEPGEDEGSLVHPLHLPPTHRHNNELHYHELPQHLHPSDTHQHCPVECAPFIYPMLDWGSNPLMAVITTVGGCVAVPLCHVVWWLVMKLREYIAHALLNRADAKGQMEDDSNRKTEIEGDVTNCKI